MPHYFEFYLFGGLACIFIVYLIAYAVLLWFGKRARRKQTYYGYPALGGWHEAPRENRRA